MFAVLTSAAQRRNGDQSDKNDPYKTALSAMSNVGNLMKEIMSVVDASSAVSLSITNNCANCQLSDPKWYMMPGTKMDGPPAFVLKNQETMIVTMQGTNIPSKN